MFSILHRKICKRQSGVNGPHGRIYVVPTREARLLVTVGLKFRSQPPDGSARGLAVPFYPSEAVGSYHLTFTLKPVRATTG